MQEDYTTEVKSKSKALASLYESLESIVFAIVLVLFLFTFVAKLSIVEGTSMVPTLHDRDYLIVSNTFFSYEPEQGDVVVIQSEKHEGALVKRVIATGGQQVHISYNAPFDGSFKIYVDGELYEDVHANFDGPLYLIPDFYEYKTTVPEGEVFVLGDNRNVSLDSRSLGTFKESEILGKVVFRLLPFQNIGAIK